MQYRALRKGTSPAKILALTEGAMDISWLLQSFRGRRVADLLDIQIGPERKHMPTSNRMKWSASEWGWETPIEMSEATYGALIWGAYWLTENQSHLGQISTEQATYSFLEAVKMGLDEDFAETVAEWDRVEAEARQAELRRKELEAEEIERAAAAFRADQQVKEQETRRRWHGGELHRKISAVPIPLWVSRGGPRSLHTTDYVPLRKALDAHEALESHEEYRQLLQDEEYMRAFPGYAADIQRIRSFLKNLPAPTTSMSAVTAAPTGHRPPDGVRNPHRVEPVQHRAEPVHALKLAQIDPKSPVEWLHWRVTGSTAHARMSNGSQVELDRAYLGWLPRLDNMWAPCQIVRTAQTGSRRWSDSYFVSLVGMPLTEKDYRAQQAQKESSASETIAVEASAYWSWLLSHIAASGNLLGSVAHPGAPGASGYTNVTLRGASSAIKQYKGKDVVYYWFGLWNVRNVAGQVHLYGAVKYTTSAVRWGDAPQMRAEGKLPEGISEWVDFGSVGTVDQVIEHLTATLSSGLSNVDNYTRQTIEDVAQKILIALWGLPEDSRVPVAKGLSLAGRLASAGGPASAPMSLLVECGQMLEGLPGTFNGHTLDALGKACRAAAISRVYPEYVDRLVRTSTWSSHTSWVDASAEQQWQLLLEDPRLQAPAQTSPETWSEHFERKWG